MEELVLCSSLNQQSQQTARCWEGAPQIPSCSRCKRMVPRRLSVGWGPGKPGTVQSQTLKPEKERSRCGGPDWRPERPSWRQERLDWDVHRWRDCRGKASPLEESVWVKEPRSSLLFLRLCLSLLGGTCQVVPALPQGLEKKVPTCSF